MPFSLFSGTEYLFQMLGLLFGFSQKTKEDIISLENVSQLALVNLFVYALGLVLLLTCSLLYRHLLNGLGVPATFCLTHPWQIESLSCPPEVIAYIHEGPSDVC